MRHIKNLVFTSIIVVVSHHAIGQLCPFQDEDAMITPNFQKHLIRAKKISQITIHYFSKPDGLPIEDGGIVYRYFFDTTGKITGSLYTTKAGHNTWDTIKCRYWYDANGNLIIKRTQSGDFYDAWYYKWNKDTLLQTEYHVQETSEAGPEEAFKMATQKVIAADSFAYIIYPKQTQQYAYNDDNKIFKKTIIQYDDNRHFISRTMQYAVGWLYSDVDLTYDSVGRIHSYVVTGNLDGDLDKKTTIKYDSLGKITEQYIWEDGKQTHHIEYMYDDATGLISNKLDRDIVKATIDILRFSYEMYGHAK